MGRENLYSTPRWGSINERMSEKIGEQSAANWKGE
jgi:hypothetical protein